MVILAGRLLVSTAGRVKCLASFPPRAFKFPSFILLSIAAPLSSEFMEPHSWRPFHSDHILTAMKLEQSDLLSICDDTQVGCLGFHSILLFWISFWFFLPPVPRNFGGFQVFILVRGCTENET